METSFDILYNVAAELDDLHGALQKVIKREGGVLAKELRVVDRDVKTALSSLGQILNALA